MDLHLLSFEQTPNNCILAVYCNSETPNSFLVGKLLLHDARGLSLTLISPDGNDDGICFCAANSIFRIELHSHYLKNLPLELSNCVVPKMCCDTWDSFLLYAERQKFIIQIREAEKQRTMFGISTGHTDDAVIIQQVSLHGELGKEQRIERHKVALLVCNSTSEKKLQVIVNKRGDRNV